MLPWTHSSQHLKRRLDQFSRFCTADGRVPILCNGPILSPSKLPLRVGDLDPIWYVFPWAHQIPQPKPHLDRFSGFCRAHDRDRQTDRQTTLLGAMRPNDVILLSLCVCLFKWVCWKDWSDEHAQCQQRVMMMNLGLVIRIYSYRQCVCDYQSSVPCRVFADHRHFQNCVHCRSVAIAAVCITCNRYLWVIFLQPRSTSVTCLSTFRPPISGLHHNRLSVSDVSNLSQPWLGW